MTTTDDDLKTGKESPFSKYVEPILERMFAAQREWLTGQFEDIERRITRRVAEQVKLEVQKDVSEARVAVYAMTGEQLEIKRRIENIEAILRTPEFQEALRRIRITGSIAPPQMPGESGE